MEPGMSCYQERSHLLALLAQHYPAGFYRDEEEEIGYRNVLTLHINGRWLSWHISDYDLPLFTPLNLSEFAPNWDGHTTAEKYEHISNAIGQYENA